MKGWAVGETKCGPCQVCKWGLFSVDSFQLDGNCSYCGELIGNVTQSPGYHSNIWHWRLNLIAQMWEISISGRQLHTQILYTFHSPVHLKYKMKSNTMFPPRSNWKLISPTHTFCLILFTISTKSEPYTFRSHCWSLSPYGVLGRTFPGFGVGAGKCGVVDGKEDEGEGLDEEQWCFY